MVDKVKGKKTKTASKKTTSRPTKPHSSDETIISTAHSQNRKIVRNQSGERDSGKEAVEFVAEDFDENDEDEFRPPLEQKFQDEDEDVREVSSFIAPRTGQQNSKTEPEAEFLNVKLSRSLFRKIKDQAADEGISLEEFVTELLAESVVLRAWEIVERKNQMKGNPGGSPMGNNNRNNSSSNANPANAQRGQRGNKGHRGMNPLRYQNIMEDKASFLEYVRSQERNRR